MWCSLLKQSCGSSFYVRKMPNDQDMEDEDKDDLAELEAKIK